MQINLPDSDFISAEVAKFSPDVNEYCTTNTKYQDRKLWKISYDDEVVVRIQMNTYEKLKMYAQKHPIEFDDLLLLIREGYLEGKNHLKKKMKEASALYPFEGVKSLLINQARSNNKGIFRNSYDYRKGFGTEPKPALIREIGFENAMYYEAWTEIFKVHGLYNEDFKEINQELHKKYYISDFDTSFPKRNVKYDNHPDSIQCSTDLFDNCEELLILLKLKEIPFVDVPGGNRVMAHKMKPHCLKGFGKLCQDFLKEAANNHEKGLVEIDKITPNFVNAI